MLQAFKQGGCPGFVSLPWINRDQTMTAFAKITATPLK